MPRTREQINTAVLPVQRRKMSSSGSLDSGDIFKGLTRRQKSILDWKRPFIRDQKQLAIVILELKELSEDQCLLLLNNKLPFDTAKTLHF